VGDMAEDFRALKEHTREQRAEKRAAGTTEILALRDRGFKVEELTDCQFRINGRLDLFPTRRRYHDIKANRRGRYTAAVDIAERVLGGSR
jgi:hypothetical protein